MELERFSLVFLRWPPDAPTFTEQELDSIQEAHLAYLASMRERGAMVASGPFADQPDESWRGMSVYVTDVEETRGLAEADPAVQVRRLAVDVLTWLVPPGVFPPRAAEGR